MLFRRRLQTCSKGFPHSRLELDDCIWASGVWHSLLPHGQSLYSRKQVEPQVVDEDQNGIDTEISVKSR